MRSTSCASPSWRASRDSTRLKFTPRGGGTGTNGQSLTDGVSVDLSRHMNAILEINAEEGWARVQAGVVKDQLNAAVAANGLFFAPELSPSNRATIGGMIATDASGQGSVLYGKTRDHVMELRAVFMDGTAVALAAADHRGARNRERPQRSRRPRASRAGPHPAGRLRA